MCKITFSVYINCFSSKRLLLDIKLKLTLFPFLKYISLVLLYTCSMLVIPNKEHLSLKSFIKMACWAFEMTFLFRLTSAILFKLSQINSPMGKKAPA